MVPWSFIEQLISHLSFIDYNPGEIGSSFMAMEPKFTPIIQRLYSVNRRINKRLYIWFEASLESENPKSLFVKLVSHHVCSLTQYALLRQNRDSRHL